MDKSQVQTRLPVSISTRLPMDKHDSAVPAWRRCANPPTPTKTSERTLSLAEDTKFNQLSRRTSKRSSIGNCLSRDLVKPGTIIRAPLHEAHFGIPESPGFSEDKSTTPSRYGPIHTKVRKMIIISCYEDHYVCLPCYSHQGRGLERKTKPDEFVSIRDHRNTNAADFQALSKHTPLVTGQLTDVTEPFHPSSIIRLTYPVSRPYASNCVKEGQLTRESLDRLIKLYVKYGLKIPADV